MIQDGWGVLLEAADDGLELVVRKLLDRGTEVDTTDSVSEVRTHSCLIGSLLPKLGWSEYFSLLNWHCHKVMCRSAGMRDFDTKMCCCLAARLDATHDGRVKWT